jgi:hypothetical protein
LKVSKDGKSEFITIRVTENLKRHAEVIWQEKYSTLQFNTFLGQMIDVGLKEEAIRLEEEKLRREARVRDASKPGFLG